MKVFFFQAEDGIRDLVRSRGLGDVYKRQVQLDASFVTSPYSSLGKDFQNSIQGIYVSRAAFNLSLIHI